MVIVLSQIRVMGKGAGTRHETAFGGMLFTAGGTGKQQRRHPSLLGNSFLGPPWMAVREAGWVGVQKPRNRPSRTNCVPSGPAVVKIPHCCVHTTPVAEIPQCWLFALRIIYIMLNIGCTALPSSGLYFTVPIRTNSISYQTIAIS